MVIIMHIVKITMYLGKIGNIITLNHLIFFINGGGMCSHSFFDHQFIDDSFYRIFNAYHKYTNCELPSEERANNWTSILDTSGYS